MAQDWAVPLAADLMGDVVDAREFDPPADPGGEPAPTDRILCDATPPGEPFAGKLALIFKGPFGAGDCLVEDKVIHAQEAGAIGVILWDGFGGLPGQIAPGRQRRPGDDPGRGPVAGTTARSSPASSARTRPARTTR